MTKGDIWVAYRDIADYPRQQFERLDPPTDEALQVKPGIIPGMFGLPDVPIAWHTGNIQGVMVHLVTYTEKPVKRKRARQFLHEAFKFAASGENEGG
jgi:hypothetical protein